MQSLEQRRWSNDFLTIAQVILSGLGLAFALIGAGLLFVLGLAALLGETLDLNSITSIMSAAWVSGLVVALSLPSLYYSFQRFRGAAAPAAQTARLRRASLLLLVWPLALALGNLVARQGTLAWLFLPPLHLLAVGLPIWWLVEFARWRLPVSSRQREWGLLNASLLVTTPVIVAVEIAVFGVLLILFAVWASSQPDVLAQLEILGQRILNSQPNPESILRVTRPYLQNPLVLVSILALLAGIIPLVEELLKPLALWALAGRRLTPVEGFSAGALCGGAFALLESLLSLINPAQGSWAALALGRAGTALLHTTTTALVGWALASAWQSGSYAGLGLTYLLASGLHGLWNAFSVLSAFGVLLENPPDHLRMLSGISRAAPYGIILLVPLLCFLLWSRNRNLRTHHLPAGLDPAIPVNSDVQ